MGICVCMNDPLPASRGLRRAALSPRAALNLDPAKQPTEVGMGRPMSVVYANGPPYLCEPPLPPPCAMLLPDAPALPMPPEEGPAAMLVECE